MSKHGRIIYLALPSRRERGNLSKTGPTPRGSQNKSVVGNLSPNGSKYYYILLADKAFFKLLQKGIVEPNLRTIGQKMRLGKFIQIPNPTEHEF